MKINCRPQQRVLFTWFHFQRTACFLHFHFLVHKEHSVGSSNVLPHSLHLLLAMKETMKLPTRTTSATMKFVFLVAAAAMWAVPSSEAAVTEVETFPITDAPADCTGYTHGADLSDTVQMFFVLTTTQLSVRLDVAVESWVAFGISPDGKMVGSDAIIGLPDEAASQSNPGKYTLEGYKEADVIMSAAQTLTDGEISQETGKTTLKFTKVLVESDENPISTTGVNYFLWAHGTENAFGEHAGTGAKAFAIDAASTLCVPTTETDGAAAPTGDAPPPTKAPVSAPSVPTLEPAPSPTTTAGNKTSSGAVSPSVTASSGGTASPSSGTTSSGGAANPSSSGGTSSADDGRGTSKLAWLAMCMALPFFL